MVDFISAMLLSILERKSSGLASEQSVSPPDNVEEDRDGFGGGVEGSLLASLVLLLLLVKMHNWLKIELYFLWILKWFIIMIYKTANPPFVACVQ